MVESPTKLVEDNQEDQVCPFELLSAPDKIQDCFKVFLATSLGHGLMKPYGKQLDWDTKILTIDDRPFCIDLTEDAIILPGEKPEIVLAVDPGKGIMKSGLEKAIARETVTTH